MEAHMVLHMDPHMNAHMVEFIKLQTKKRLFLTALWILNNVLLTFIHSLRASMRTMIVTPALSRIIIFSNSLTVRLYFNALSTVSKRNVSLPLSCTMYAFLVLLSILFFPLLSVLSPHVGLCFCFFDLIADLMLDI